MPSYIYYWSPCLNKVGTVKSTINSVLSLSKYSNSKFVPVVINACGEWDEYKDFFKSNNIKIVNLSPFNYYKYLPKTGFIQSSLSYIIIFIFSFLPLIKILRRNEVNYLIAHLITSLPLFIFYILNLNSKLILRISGYPKLNILRAYFWKKVSKTLFKITCPSLELLNKIEKSNIFKKNQLYFLPDAIIQIDEFKKKKILINNKEFDKSKKIVLSVGRLTKQKNFKYLIDEFEIFSKNQKDYILVILGDGEQKNYLKKYISSRKLDNKIYLMGRTENVYQYMKKSEVFVLSSLWEEVGFVIVEAAISNLFVISSNCPNGPSEFLDNGNHGILFENNKKNKLSESLEAYLKLNKEKRFCMRLNLKKEAMKYTIFRHYLILKKLLINEN